MASPSKIPLQSSGELLPMHPNQQPAEQHFQMCPINLLPEQQPACFGGQQLGDATCEAFCQPLHQSFPTEFHEVPNLYDCPDFQEFQNLNGQAVRNSGRGAAGNDGEDRLSARKVHKADREKLRRDRLNEQFLELANALDPDRPKNDKATILAQSVQVVKELRAEVKRLKTEHDSLLIESHDLTQEKNELREEKIALKNDTEKVQTQLQHCIHTISPWMGLDPSAIMGAGAFPYPVPVPQSVSLPPSDSQQTTPSRPLVTPTPYIPFTPPVSPFQMHPSLHPYAVFGNKHGDGNNPYLHYPSFAPSVSSHSHIERPYAQYPSPLQPIPGFAAQVQPSHGSQSQPSAPSPVTPIYRPCVAGIPVASMQSHGSSQRSKGGSDCSHAVQGGSQLMQADLQLQTPSQTLTALQCQPQTSEPTLTTGLLRSESADSEVREQIDTAMQHTKTSGSICSAITKSWKEQTHSSLYHGGLLNMKGNLIAEKESRGSADASEGRPGQVLDPTLSSPAA